MGGWVCPLVVECDVGCKSIVLYSKPILEFSGVARGALKGLEHPLSQKRKKNRIGIFQKKKL